MSGSLKDYVLSALPMLDLSASRVEVEGEHTVKVVAQRQDSPGTLVLEAKNQKHKVGLHNLKQLKAEMMSKNASQAIFVSASGFTAEAYGYSHTNGIQLLTPADIEAMNSSPAQSKKPSHNIYERVYKPSVTLDEAKALFEGKRRRLLLGLIGEEERVDSVEARFAPIGCFHLRKRASQEFSQAGLKTVEGENTMYVNLATCELYYAYKGIAGKGGKLKSTNILRRMMDLPESAVRLMSLVLEEEELLIDKLGPKELQMLHSNFADLAILQKAGLIVFRADIRGYISNVNIPQFPDD